ncbi:MAG: DUF3558 family protein [Acidimicrobiales bacterium]
MLLVLSVLLAACGDDTDGPQSGSSNTTAEPDSTATDADAGTTEPDTPTDLPDPCSLLTPEDIEAATGQTFGAGTINDQITNSMQTACDWGADSVFGSVLVIVNETGQRLVDPDLAELEEGFGEPVVEVDLADDAYRSERGNILAMRVGDLFVSLTYSADEDGDVSEITMSLATTILANLG